MDCQTFDSSLLDALYDELDTEASTAMDEHAAGCASCATRIARLKRTQELIRPALELPSPEGLEARILAAVEKAETARGGVPLEGAPAAAADVIPLGDHRHRARAVAASPEPEKQPGGVVAFLSRPQFAIAAAFVLVLGATLLFASNRSEKAATTGAVAAASGAGQAPDDSPAPPPAAEPAPAAEVTASALALATPPPSPHAPPQAAPRARHDRDLDGEDGVNNKAKPSGGGAAKTPAADPGAASSPAFASAKALYDAGKYAEALPKFDALAATDPVADLYAARSIARTRGCTAAAPRFDRIAQANTGTERGSRAALEIARCLKNAGQASAARTRYQALATDNYVAQEANADLAALEAPQAVQAAKPAAPVAKPPPAATSTASSGVINDSRK
jgi:hypothetical protein